jgi:hypothetical protein
MKKILLITLSLLLAIVSYAQVVYDDNGPLIDEDVMQLQ